MDAFKAHNIQMGVEKHNIDFIFSFVRLFDCVIVMDFLSLNLFIYACVWVCVHIFSLLFVMYVNDNVEEFSAFSTTLILINLKCIFLP